MSKIQRWNELLGISLDRDRTDAEEQELDEIEEFYHDQQPDDDAQEYFDSPEIDRLRYGRIRGD